MSPTCQHVRCSNVLLHHCFLASFSFMHPRIRSQIPPNSTPYYFLIPLSHAVPSGSHASIFHPDLEELSSYHSNVFFSSGYWHFLFWSIKVPGTISDACIVLWTLSTTFPLLFSFLPSPLSSANIYWVATTHQTPVFTAHWPTSTLKFSSALFNNHPFPKVHPLGLPDLAHWNRGCPVTFEV